MRINRLSVALALAGLASFGSVHAATLAVNPLTSSPQPGGTVTGVQLVASDTAGTRGWNLTLQLPTGVSAANMVENATVTGDIGSCSYDGGTNRVIALAANLSSDIPSGVACTFDLVMAGGESDGDQFVIEQTAAPGCNPSCTSTVTDASASDLGTMGVVEAHVITVAITPVRPTLSFPATGTASGGNIGQTGTGTLAVTSAGGSGSGAASEASYTCTEPAGFTLTDNGTQSGLLPSEEPLDIGFSCTLAAAQASANMNCSVTDGAGAPRNVTIGLTCPQGSVPTVDGTITASPATGSTLAISGAAFTNGQSTVALNNSNGSGAGSTTISCTATAPVQIAFVGGGAFGAGPITQTVTGATNPADLVVQVPLTDADQAVINNAVTCTQDFANDMSAPQALASYNVDPAAGVTFVAPNVIPASSLWSQLSLIGLLAGLGGLMVALRRNA